MTSSPLSSMLLLLVLAACTTPLASAVATPFDVPFPPQMTLKTAVLTNTVPLAYYDEDHVPVEGEIFPAYRGFQPDLMRYLVKIAKDYEGAKTIVIYFGVGLLGLLFF